MFERILIATDNSPLMRNAIQYTAQAFPYADYHLINVINTSDGSIPQTPLMQSHLKKIAKEALKKGSNILKDMGIADVKLAMPSGRPSKEIMKYTYKKNVDLIVMATHSKSGTQRVHIGETAIHSLQLTHIPSLVFSCECEPKIPASIFNPTSFSKYSVEASILAQDLASYFGARLTTFHFGSKDPGEAVGKIKNRAKKKGIEFDLVIDKDANDEKLLRESKKYDLMVGSRGRGSLIYKFRHLIPRLALSNLEKELIAEGSIPFLMIGD